MRKDFAPLLLGRDFRSIGRSNEVVRLVDDQESFDALFNLLLHHERLLVMRAADAIEKVTTLHPHYLHPHKKQLLSLLKSAMHKELKWHLALLVVRTDLTAEETTEVWSVLAYWAQNPNESKIVRVNCIQGLWDLTNRFPELQKSFAELIKILEREPIPSLQARIKKLKKSKYK